MMCLNPHVDLITVWCIVAHKQKKNAYELHFLSNTIRMFVIFISWTFLMKIFTGKQLSQRYDHERSLQGTGIVYVSVV
jgi:hypothetical protein